jgi:hypothetical protein
MLLLTILASLAQNESLNKSEDIKWGIRQNFQDRDTKYARRSCYGYECGTDGRLVIEPQTTAVVQMIFKLYLGGYSLRGISKQLFELGIPAPHGGVKWGPETIRYVLSNEKYRGDVVLQKTFVADFLTGKQIKNRGQLTRYLISDSHVGVVSREVFEAAQRELERRGKDLGAVDQQWWLEGKGDRVSLNISIPSCIPTEYIV